MRYWRNTETGEVHKEHDDGSTMEECNKDDCADAGHLEELADHEEAMLAIAADDGSACGHCCPEKEGDDAVSD